MQLPVTCVSSRAFIHNAKEKKLVAEHSDIGSPEFSALYNDACDRGLALRNHRTNNITRWTVCGFDNRNPDRELVAWVLVPTPESLRKWPDMAGYKMVIIND